MSNFVFKRGDTFNLNLQLVDMDDALQYPANDVRRAIDLTGYTFTSQVKTLDGTAVATFICAVLNQSTQKGWLNVKSAASTTKLLNLGDIGLLIWSFIKEQAQKIQEDVDKDKATILGKSSSSTSTRKRMHRKRHTKSNKSSS